MPLAWKLQPLIFSVTGRFQIKKSDLSDFFYFFLTNRFQKCIIESLKTLKIQFERFGMTLRE